QVPGVGGRCVVHGAVVGGGLVVEHGRADGAGAADQVLADDGHHQTGRADVLLGAGIDHAELRHVHRTGQDVGGHVHHQRHVAHLGHPVELHATDGFVAAVVQVGGILRQLPVVLARDGEV